MPKVSVIVPVYNVEKYLNRCLDSILAQTFKDFELILIDDGSIDNSSVICDDYAKKDERIKVLHKTNGGLSDARNAGIDVASGEYLSFIDSDDWVEKNFIEVLYGNAVKKNADISAVNLRKVYDDHEDEEERVFEGCYSNVDAMNFLYGNCSIYANVACNKLYKKDLFENIRYPKGKTHEDGFTTYKLLYYSKRIHFSNECLYNYYQRSGSIMNKTFNINRVHEYEVYCERKIFFEQETLSELVYINEKTRLACMKTLTIKLIKYHIPERKKYFSVFKNDVKQNDDIMNRNANNSEKIINYVFRCSPEIFSLIYKLKKCRENK